MKSSTAAAVGGASLGFAGVAIALASRRGKLAPLDRMTHKRADALTFTEVAPGASMAVLRGNPETGSYAAFTRFAPGAKFPLHTHPHEICMVVLSGAYLYGTSEGETRVGAGSYLVIPAGVPHWSAGDAAEGCLFFQDGPGKFGLDYLR
jgi:quercetin dioxygenase-like cupin family protein